MLKFIKKENNVISVSSDFKDFPILTTNPSITRRFVKSHTSLVNFNYADTVTSPCIITFNEFDESQEAYVRVLFHSDFIKMIKVHIIDMHKMYGSVMDIPYLKEMLRIFPYENEVLTECYTNLMRLLKNNIMRNTLEFALELNKQEYMIEFTKLSNFLKEKVGFAFKTRIPLSELNTRLSDSKFRLQFKFIVKKLEYRVPIKMDCMSYSNMLSNLSMLLGVKEYRGLENDCKDITPISELMYYPALYKNLSEYNFTKEDDVYQLNICVSIFMREVTNDPSVMLTYKSVLFAHLINSIVSCDLTDLNSFYMEFFNK